jgi:Helix-turn-helix domain
VDDRRHAIALFRHALVREAADPALTTRQRGALVRQLAERDHLGPDGQRVRVSRNTLDRWIRAWRAGGFEALLPADRSTAQLRSPLELLELAAALKREAPMRTSAQITQILRASHPDQPQIPSSATIRRYFHGSACIWAWRSRRLGIRAWSSPTRAADLGWSTVCPIQTRPNCTTASRPWPLRPDGHDESAAARQAKYARSSHGPSSPGLGSRHGTGTGSPVLAEVVAVRSPSDTLDRGVIDDVVKPSPTRWTDAGRPYGSCPGGPVEHPP